MLGFIISMIVVGLIAGAIGRLVVSGTSGMSIPLTILLGIIGSFIGGFLGYLLFHKDAQAGAFQPSGLIGSIIGAIIVVFLWVRFSGKKHVTR
ncbi:GlsB/YeaQ/YmgE family stress response membrane protein [Nakamurella sp. A5-74]|uniref:GlsB/YeaQ/YmgE family stress response membrane protein n=1 Tax=Nakamurella sp. A5-74 TaxID=3158264 RepID=A0AAU8DP19_9ACTN